MTTTAQELERFTQFARRRLAGEDPEPSLDELFDFWRMEHPSDADYAENVAAVAPSLTVNAVSREPEANTMAGSVAPAAIGCIVRVRVPVAVVPLRYALGRMSG